MEEQNARKGREVLIAEVVDAVRSNFVLNMSQRKQVEAEYAELCNNKGAMSWRRYRKTMNTYIHNHECASGVKRKISYDTQKHQQNRLKALGLKSDANISESEFVNAVRYVSMLVSLIPYKIDNIALMRRNGFNDWLVERLNLIGDMETNALIQEYIKKGDDEAEVQDIIDGVFDRAFPPDASDPYDFHKFTSWQILGASVDDNRHCQGLEVEASNVRVVGGSALPAWEFSGDKSSFVKVSSPAKNGFGKSVTVATFFYQDVLDNGPILEFEGDSRNPCGFHFWNWDKKGLFANLRTVDGKEHNVFFKLLTPKQWQFVGVSYDASKGNILMWVDGDIMEKSVGKLDVDLAGDVYSGIRPSSPGWRPFKGRLAGLTLLDGPIQKEKISALKEKVASQLQ